MGRCYSCEMCQLGHHNLCGKAITHHVGYGFDGGWAELCSTSADHIYPIDQSLSAAPEVAVLIEPMGVVVSGLAKLTPYMRSGSSVLILGGGLVGTLLATVMSYRGFRDIVVSEPSAARRQKLAEIRGVTAKPPEDLRQQGPEIYDVVVECCGIVPAVEEALRHIRQGGALLLLGIFNKGSFAQLSPHHFMFSEISLLSALGNHHSFAEAAALVANMFRDGALTAERMGLKVFPIDDFESALTDLKDKAITKAILKHARK